MDAQSGSTATEPRANAKTDQLKDDLESLSLKSPTTEESSATENSAPMPMPQSPGNNTHPLKTPPTRKRISMNFALPVVNSSNADSPVSAGHSGSSRRVVSSTTAARKSPKQHEALPNLVALTSSSSSSIPALSAVSSSSITSANGYISTSSPLTSANVTGLNSRPRHGHNMSQSSSSSSGSAVAPSNSTSAVAVSSYDGFFSELAAKERRVLELRDELARIKAQLKAAENDLKQFRDGAAYAVSGGVQTPRAENEQARFGDVNANTNASPSSPTSRKSMLASLKNMSPQPGSPGLNLGTSNLLKNSSAHLPPPEDVLNMGKRVVEEIGTQFWTFVGDIKNVAIGEDSREFTDDQGHQQGLTQGQSQSHTQSYDMIRQDESPRKPTASARPSFGDIPDRESAENEADKEKDGKEKGGKEKEQTDSAGKHTRNKRSVSVNSYYML